MLRFPEIRLSRRDWLARNAAAAAASIALPFDARARPAAMDSGLAARLQAQACLLDPAPVEALARHAVDAAKAAGAAFADVRLTRDLVHWYVWDGRVPMWDVQTLGVGVRALVNGYWGFAGSTLWDPDEVVRLAQEAVRVATINARGPHRDVELGQYPVAMGRWSTPVRIDPFSVTMEEKTDAMQYWDMLARKCRCYIFGASSYMMVARQERTVATSEGGGFTQTLYETGGRIVVMQQNDSSQTSVLVRDIAPTGGGWEVLLDAKIPAQMPVLRDELPAKIRLNASARPVTIGQYTLVCDGATMAAMAEHTLGLATQLDRAMGYEANAGGTSYLDDPLAMVGQEKVASPLVTLTADRSMPGGLATVKWDDEGVEPDTCTLVKDGILTDFQTTRESAAWLKDYYTKTGTPVRSHGHTMAASGMHVPLQQMPNVALAPNPSGPQTEDLIGDVADGVYVEAGTVRSDFQAKHGMLFGEMRRIGNGRLGPKLVGGAVLFSSTDFWKKVTAVAGPAAQMTIPSSRYAVMGGLLMHPDVTWWQKGQPPQATNHSVRGVAAAVASQGVIDPSRRG